ncbi:PHB depolymerase family esterase [Variovorax sp. J22R133]|uniref:extracellular catalytic domain type 1 short-chain-length polyhydroxyalkanoate depolymerase n=1 Tax=Variovorax brevis TaxID=3053503 RepID=UPI0025783E5E|nr:PHB depolymerase family esterase [Variovorax sp. J22R133]MDM0111009.1 PHB depolymerase family esterase [Variovorax sp. J22R133]
MNFHFKQTMAEATRMVRAGNLRGATAVIQAALSRNKAEPSDAPHADAPHAATTAAFVDADPLASGVNGASGANAAGGAAGFKGFNGFKGFKDFKGFKRPEAANGAKADGFTDVVDVLARFVPQPTPDEVVVDTPPPIVDTPPGEGQFLAGSFAIGHDHRDYKLFVPPHASDRALPLVVMLHGCTQNPDDFAAGTAMNDFALSQGFFVLYPGQSRRANPQGCWNWFKHNHQKRDRGEPALLAGMTREVMATYRIDADRVYVAGLSAGGAMSAVLGDAYPDLYAAVGVHSGLAAGMASDLPSAMMAMMGGTPVVGRQASGVPTIAFHGDADSTVHPSNGDHVMGACVGDTCELETQRVSAGGVREATRTVYRSADGRVLAEMWKVHGAPHAWSGGSAKGSFTDGQGPDASAEMLRFFFDHPRAPAM